MHIRLHHLLALTICAPLAAQQYFTSPAGLVSTEGSSNHDYILFAKNKLRWQQLDSSSISSPYANVKSIAWRRDATAANDATWIARTVDLTVVMSHAVGIGSSSTVFANNYKGAPTTVFTKKTVNLPDWTAKPATSPDAWTAIVPFDNMWSYNGVDNFLWEVQADNNSTVGSNNSGSDYGNDFQSGTGSFSTSNAGTIIGTGCISTGRTSQFTLSTSLYNHGSKFRMTASASNAPANASVIRHIDLANANLMVPGLCATVYALPTLSIPLGTSSATGSVSTVTIDNIKYNASWIGLKLYSQALALDAGQAGLPVSLSYGRENTFPADPALPAQARFYEYATSSGMTTSGPWTGGIVARFEY